MANFEISFDLSQIDFRATSDILKESYWGSGRSDELHRRAFANSLCVGAYVGGNQVGFGRAITDRTVFAYLADIIVWPGYRGQGIGTRLVQALSTTRIARLSPTGACLPTMPTRSTRSSASGLPPTAAICASTASRQPEQRQRTTDRCCKIVSLVGPDALSTIY
ncbi:GNAT family N-acetyltransferase [Mesorhizobium sp. M0960]|uniref:GNAT family N-acetyltransferase n=1 Tax=Mesorhizobium sp. M0960 TaxID=2957035 RepID=UPI00333D1E92